MLVGAGLEDLLWSQQIFQTSTIWYHEIEPAPLCKSFGQWVGVVHHWARYQ